MYSGEQDRAQFWRQPPDFQYKKAPQEKDCRFAKINQIRPLGCVIIDIMTNLIKIELNRLGINF